MQRRTSIICSLGPATHDLEILRAMVEAGMDWARLNFSHGLPEARKEAAKLVREAASSAGRQVKILADLEGPKLRIGDLPAPLELRKGIETVLHAGFAGRPGEIPLTDPRAFKAVRVGDTIFLDDGAVEIEVLEALDPLRYRVVVTVGGVADSHCGLTFLGKDLDLPVLSSKDLDDIVQARELGVDYIAQSMVRSRRDVDELRRRLPPGAPIVAKIERSSALNDLERIAAVAWGLMVARGDLGVNIPRAQVPLKQKEILELTRRCGCFGIVATQMLLSMVQHRRPTRAEVSDVATAIIDGCDAVMLSEETSIGAHPVDAVRELAEIIETVESSRWYQRERAGR